MHQNVTSSFQIMVNSLCRKYENSLQCQRSQPMTLKSNHFYTTVCRNILLHSRINFLHEHTHTDAATKVPAFASMARARIIQ